MYHNKVPILHVCYTSFIFLMNKLHFKIEYIETKTNVLSILVNEHLKKICILQFFSIKKYRRRRFRAWQILHDSESSSWPQYLFFKVKCVSHFQSAERNPMQDSSEFYRWRGFNFTKFLRLFRIIPRVWGHIMGCFFL